MATISDLITELREDFLEDSVAPYQWSDTKLLRYLNEAIREACRSPLFRSTQTITVSDGTASYTLDDDTLDIDEVWLALQTEPLSSMAFDQMPDKYGASWQEAEGTPQVFTRKDLTLTLYPIPIVADTMTVYSFKYPETIVSASATPEIPELYHHSLCYWAAYKAYLTPDVDQGSLDRSQQFLSLFDRAFGVKRSARYEMIQKISPKYLQVAPVRMC